MPLPEMSEPTGRGLSATGAARRASPAIRRCLLLFGAAGLAGGRPVDEVESELRRMGRALGEHDVQCAATRSEEHTSELQSHSDLVCRLLLGKKKTGGPKLS